MSYCPNPACTNPKNHLQATLCQTCGFKLLLKGRYRIGRILGKGGFGATFLAIDLSLPGHPYCVLKQLRPASNSQEVFQMAKELFEREATTLGKIGNHPQIPRLLDYFEEEHQFYLVQEYVKGLNLQQEVKRKGRFSEAGIKQFLQEILSVLQYVHSQQVIHRDIKPANIIRREQDGKLVLIDFGAVKDRVNPAIGANTYAQTALTAFAIGTAGFAPPEQLAMRPVYASDIYAVGITCVYLLTGKSPKDLEFDDKTGEILWRKQVTMSEHLAKILQTMLEVSVRHRYKSADEVLGVLELEDHLDNLAEGLIVQGNTDISKPLAPEQPNPSSNRVATSKLATAIRARNARRGQIVNSGIFQPDTFNAVSTEGTVASTSSREKTLGTRSGLHKAEEILKSYTQGRRDFAQQNLSNLNLRKANLSGCIFHQSSLRYTNFQDANLASTDFGRANLSQAVLKGAILHRAYLSYTDLQGADLRGADLQFAHLKYANLKGANLCGANLSHAIISEEQLAQAKTNWATVLPNGKRGLW